MLNSSPLRRPCSSSRPLSTVLVALLASLTFGAALANSLINAASASAHTKVVKVTPGPDARLTAAPLQVVAEFNEPVSTSFATVVVTSAAGANVALGKPTVDGASVTQALSPRLAAGSYRVAFRVVSKDGHPVSGESRFTLTLPATARPTTTSPSTSVPVASPPATPSVVAAEVAPAVLPKADQGGGNQLPLAIAGGVGVLVLGAGALLWRRTRP